ncbi:MAG: hypothetical protein ACREQV_14190, partial [Candidatus Binatia bacterium]
MNVNENLQTASYHGEMETSFKVLTTGSVLETLGGIAAVVLSILGLVGVVPFYMAAIAAIAFGVGLMAEGAGATVNSDAARTGNGAMHRSETIGGSGAELLGGLAGGILGLLALLSISPMVLLSVASIVFGAALLLGSVSTARLRSIGSGSDQHLIAQESIEIAAGAQVLVGLAAIALGILAVVGIVPMTLVLAALL